MSSTFDEKLESDSDWPSELAYRVAIPESRSKSGCHNRAKVDPYEECTAASRLGNPSGLPYSLLSSTPMLGPQVMHEPSGGLRFLVLQDVVCEYSRSSVLETKKGLNPRKA